MTTSFADFETARGGLVDFVERRVDLQNGIGFGRDVLFRVLVNEHVEEGALVLKVN